MTAAPAENCSQPVCSGNFLKAGWALCVQVEGGCTRLGRSRGFLSCGEGAQGELAPSDSPGQGKGLGWTPGPQCPLMLQGPESAVHSWRV